MTDFFQHEIRNLARYRKQIRKLFAKLKERKALFTSQQAGVNYFSFGLQDIKLAKLLRATIVNESYHFGPAKQRTIVVNHKARLIYDFELLDKLVISVLMSILAELAEAYLSNQVFSYRKGRRPLNAVRKLGVYLQQQRETNPSRPECYVLKTDIADYTDNIRLDNQSKLWQLITHMLAKTDCQLTTYQQQLIWSCFRPEYINLEGELQYNIKGVPTGSVASTLAYNLYIAEIDHHMMQIKGLYYSRYSDDILLAHAVPTVLKSAIIQFNAMLNELGLQRKLAKDKAVYLTKSGRKALDIYWLGAHKLTYLGYEVYADGMFILSARRQNKFLMAIRQRIHNVLMLSHEQLAFEALGKMLCQAINNALLDEAFGEQATKALLECNHMGMLKHLDYLIALSIAMAISRQHGVRAFRKVAYSKIRNEWKLVSLVNLRILLWHPQKVG
jgi:retron-type reverse transcriptase